MKAVVQTNTLRILCISPFFAPVENSESLCAAKMVQALMERGALLTVLASHDIWGGFPNYGSPIWQSLQEITINVPQVRQPDLVLSLTRALQFQTPFFARWVERVVTLARQLHRARRFDLIYTRSLPMIAHVAGFWCARKLKLPWVANLNDPWEIGFFPGVKTEKLPAYAVRAYMFWLRRTLRNADLITYPCKGLQTFHAQLAGLDHSAEIISHVGYRPKNPSGQQNCQFRLVHAGKLGANEVTGRSSKALLSGFKAFLDSSPDAAERSRLIFVGPEDRQSQELIARFGLAENVESVGRVNYEESLRHIASASVCILIEAGGNESIFFPSKLADYLVCGKPVLALSPPAGIAADFAKRGELIRLDHDPEAVRNTIASLYMEFKRGTLHSRRPTREFVTQLQGQSVAETFLRACRSLVSQTQTNHTTARPVPALPQKEYSTNEHR